MGFLKKGSRNQGFRGSSENNETLRQAQGDKKRVQGFERQNAEEKKRKKCNNRHRDAYSWEIQSRDISILNMYTSMYTLKGEI
jgi:hypothetical protein